MEQGAIKSCNFSHWFSENVPGKIGPRQTRFLAALAIGSGPRIYYRYEISPQQWSWTTYNWGMEVPTPCPDRQCSPMTLSPPVWSPACGRESGTSCCHPRCGHKEPAPALPPPSIELSTSLCEVFKCPPNSICWKHLNSLAYYYECFHRIYETLC